MRFLSRNAAANSMMIFSVIMLACASIHHLYLRGSDAVDWDIDMIFMMNFVKFHMMAVNYKNAALLDENPVKSEK